MSLFAIADTHLSFGTDKPMDVFPGWNGYVDRLEAQWRAVVKPEDTVVLGGDISWGMSLDEATPDFAFVEALPGRKLILKGNHDYWWNTRSKMEAFFAQRGFDSLHILHNNAFDAEGAAICGTRGWFYDAEADEDKKVLLREVGRLRTSIRAGRALGLPPVVFLHYPPIYGEAVCEELMQVLREERITECYYGHIHGYGIRKAFSGEADGIRFRLISGDGLDFCPLKIR